MRMEAGEARGETPSGGEAHDHVLVEQRGVVAHRGETVLGEVPRARPDELMARHLGERAKQARIRRAGARHHDLRKHASEVREAIHGQEYGICASSGLL